MKKQFAAILALLAGLQLFAAQQMQLDLDFTRNTWQEVVKPLWGAAPRTENGSLVFGPGSFVGTPVIATPSGSIIVIEFDAENTAIEHSGSESWRTAAMQLGIFSGNKELSHTDLYNSGTPTARQHYVRRIPTSQSGFRLCFGNYGKTGEFKVSNLKIGIETPGKNVERDGSFAGMFGINDWFVQKGGKDWDNIGLGKYENAKLEANLFPTPGNTLVLTNEATVISQQFPYQGEGIVVGAWFKQENIRQSAKNKPWAHAGIQLVYLDAQDKPIGHADVTSQLLPGNRPWGYHTITIPQGGLSPKVKSVALYLRIFGGATGKAWFDDISLILQGEGQSRHYNSKSGTLKIDSAAKATELVPVWNGVDLSYCSQVDLPQVRTALKRLREEGGLEYLRTREFFNGPFPVKSIDKDGKITFDFSSVDKYVDVMVREIGVKLVPTIETLPPQLQTAPRNHVPSDYKAWKKCVKALVRHWIDRYGKEVVSQWVFECWNEPGSDFFRGSDEAFCRLFVTYLEAMTEVEKEAGVKLRIGTPSGAMNNLLSLAMADAKRAGLADAVTDISTHIYGGYDGSLELYKIDVDTVRNRMAPYTNGKDLPLHITEFNGSAMVSKHFDTQTGAAFVVKSNRIMADKGVTRSYYYCAIDHPYLNLDKHYTADLGYMTHYDAVPKPSFNALKLLNTLKGKRLKVSASSEPYDAFAAVDADGTTRIIATTFSEEELGDFKPTQLTVELDWAGRPEKLEKAEITLIDSKNGNSFAAFEKAGKPLYKENPDTSAYLKAAEMKAVPLTGYRFENGKLIIPLTMELNSVAAITVK